MNVFDCINKGKIMTQIIYQFSDLHQARVKGEYEIRKRERVREFEDNRKRLELGIRG